MYPLYIIILCLLVSSGRVFARRVDIDYFSFESPTLVESDIPFVVTLDISSIKEEYCTYYKIRPKVSSGIIMSRRSDSPDWIISSSLIHESLDICNRDIELLYKGSNPFDLWFEVFSLTDSRKYVSIERKLWVGDYSNEYLAALNKNITSNSVVESPYRNGLLLNKFEVPKIISRMDFFMNTYWYPSLLLLLIPGTLCSSIYKSKILAKNDKISR